MAHAPRRRDVVAAIILDGTEPELTESFEAPPVLQSRRAAHVAAQRQAMQGGAAAGFEVWFIPHDRGIARAVPLSNYPVFRFPRFPWARGWGRHGT